MNIYGDIYTRRDIHSERERNEICWKILVSFFFFWKLELKGKGFLYKMKEYIIYSGDAWTMVVVVVVRSYILSSVCVYMYMDME